MGFRFRLRGCKLGKRDSQYLQLPSSFLALLLPQLVLNTVILTVERHIQVLQMRCSCTLFVRPSCIEPDLYGLICPRSASPPQALGQLERTSLPKFLSLKSYSHRLNTCG